MGSFFPTILQKLKWQNVLLALLIFTLSCGLQLVYYSNESAYIVNMCQGVFGQPVLFFITAISGSLILLFFSSKMKVNSLLFIGQNTLVIYGLHNIFKDIYPIFVLKGLGMIGLECSSFIGSFIAGVIVFILTMLSLWPIINIVNRKFKFMLGKF